MCGRRLLQVCVCPPTWLLFDAAEVMRAYAAARSALPFCTAPLTSDPQSHPPRVTPLQQARETPFPPAASAE